MELYTVLAVIIVAILVLAFYWLVRGRRPGTFSEAAALVLEAEAVARVFVAGAQQIYESKKGAGVDNRYIEVEAALMKTFPNLDPRIARQIIEAAVFAKNEGQKRGWLPASGVAQVTTAEEVIRIMERASE